ncbi:hypothetical protein Tco_0833207 [Tanacetum coccineum]
MIRMRYQLPNFKTFKLIEFFLHGFNPTGGSLGPVFLLGLSAFAMVAACASRAAIKSAISCRRASKVMAGVSYGMIHGDGDNDTNDGDDDERER